jgi:hypothetical protein
MAHAVVGLVTVLRNDSHRLHSNAQRPQAIFLLHVALCRSCLIIILTLLLQLELDGVLSKENSASRRMMDVEIVMESLRNRVVELQCKLLQRSCQMLSPGAAQAKGQLQQVAADASLVDL